MPHFSKTTKMPCVSWGIPSSECKTGSLLRKRKGTACSLCYTFNGPISWKQSQAKLKNNLEEYLADSENWIRKVIAYIEWETPRFFRWFHSGDLQSVKMIRDIVAVVESCPGTQFWLPTQERVMVSKWLEGGGIVPENLNIRVSMPLIDKVNCSQVLKGVTWSVVALNEIIPFECPARQYNGSCGPCRACWNKSVEMVSYPLKVGRFYRPKKHK
jgi:hypothetical protein